MVLSRINLIESVSRIGSKIVQRGWSFRSLKLKKDGHKGDGANDDGERQVVAEADESFDGHVNVVVVQVLAPQGYLKNNILM